MKIDLHLHSTASDGAFSPKEVTRQAKEAGLSLVSLTDHDTTAGLNEAGKAAGKLGLKFIPGVEFSTFLGDHDIHMLGYFKSVDLPRVCRFNQRYQRAREERIKGMVRKLNSLELRVDLDEVMAEGDSGVIGRPHLARVLLRHGYVKNLQEAFERYLKRGRAAYVPRDKAGVGEVVDLIHRSGGIAIWAHPYPNEVKEVLLLLVERMIDGVEAHHPQLSKKEQVKLVRRAGELGLLVTGGSDWHGDEGGLKLGEFFVVESDIEGFLIRYNQ
jgi:predicted metal-dependent phosphoesterase TrpH